MQRRSRATGIVCFIAGLSCGSKSGLDSEPNVGQGRTSTGGATVRGEPDAFVAATLAPSSDNYTGCALNAAYPFVAIGAPSCGGATTVRNDGDAVQVSCSVLPAGGGFDVSLSAKTAGGSGSGFTLTGHVVPGDAGSIAFGYPTAVNAVFENAKYGSYSRPQFDTVRLCTLRATLSYAGNDCALPDGVPVGLGGIWGHVSCPTVQDIPGPPDTGCDAEADFFFESCGQ